MGRGSSRTGRKLAIALVCAAFASLAACAVAFADFPWVGAGTANDPTSWHATTATPPNDFSESDDWKMAGTPESGNTQVNSQQDELCGIRGDSTFDTASTEPEGCSAGQPVNTAWNVTTGRPDVVISVLDSGIKWNDQGAMTDLRAKVHINKGELPVPQHDLSSPIDSGGKGSCSSYADAYDANGDGVFNVLDYECDSRVAAVVSGNSLRHGPAGFLTPEDLILAFSDGTDADHNGFVDDIAGWDFVDNKNDPFDDVQYGHGTGEARDSNAEANNGGDLGMCPNCMVLPLRVGESFIADSNRFAQAVLYATDSGASIVQEALGTLNESKFTRQAIDYAYNHGVTVIASAADEAAEHHNQPGALPHTIVVNSVRKYDPTFTSTPRSYLQFNGCTNFSTRVTVAVPSSSCSSEATGRSSGIAGLIYSAALNTHDHNHLPASSDCTRVDGTPCVITPDEVRQLMASGHIGGTVPADQGAGGQADDVNFAAQPEGSCNSAPTPNCTDPNSNTAFAPDQGLVGPVAPIPKTTRYHARKGFDEFYGYGRLNAYNAVSQASAGHIPPEADITSPDWFQQLDPSKPSVEVDGFVNARSDYTCKVEVAPGAQPNNVDDFHQVNSSWCDGSTTRSSSHNGQLAQIPTGTLKGMFPPGNPSSWDGNENGGLPGQTSNGRPNTGPYAFTIRVVVTTVKTQGGPQMTGEDRRQAWLHRDQDMLAGFPKELQTDGDSSPLLVDLNGDNRNELVVATSDGEVHAYKPDGSELPGWPVHADSLPLHTGERAYTAGDGVGAGHGNAILGALAAGDLFHNGRIEIVADDDGGNVYAWDSSGHQVFHRTSNPDYSGAPLTPFHTVRRGPRDRTEHGFLSTPVLADLDGHGLDILAAGDDRHLYAWHADGSPVAGFPVLVGDPDKIASVDPTTHHLTFNSNASANPGISEDQGKLIDTPGVAKVDGPDKPPTIFLGSNEEYPVNTGDEGGINAGITNPTLLALGSTGVLSFANGRVYAIKSDGSANGSPFVAGWPKKVGIIDAGLLPDVGEGVNGSPVVAPVTCPSGGQGMKIGVAPDAGPAYIFNPDGSSCYGQSGGKDNALATDFSEGTGKYDTPTFAAVGYPAFGQLSPAPAEPDLVMPTTGLIRALDVVAPEYQGGQDFLGAWNSNTGQFRPGYPSPVNDLQFLSGPAIGDVTGSGESVIGGTASLDLAAISPAGTAASTAWPKMTGDWTIATPTLGSFGTLDTDSSAKKDVATITRMGTLSVYTTPAGACSPSSSPRYHHDDANSGDFTRDAVLPGVPMDAAISGNTVSFKAPGDDLLCGTATSYQVVTSNSPITPENFDQATPVNGAPAPAAAGSSQTFTLPGGVGRFVAIRAEDDQHNIGLPAVVDRGGGSGNVGAGQPLIPGVPGGGGSGAGRGSACGLASRLKFQVHHSRRSRVTKVQVYLNGHRVQTRRGHSIRSITVARGSRTTFTIKVVATQTRGGRLTSTRRYVNCRKQRVSTRAHHTRRRHR